MPGAKASHPANGSCVVLTEELEIMPAYVVSTEDRSSAADMPVVYPVEGKRLVAMFTRRGQAEQFAAGYGDECRIASLSAIQLLRWLTRASEEDAMLLTIDPEQPGEIPADSQAVIVIEEQLAELAEILTRDVTARKFKGIGELQAR